MTFSFVASLLLVVGSTILMRIRFGRSWKLRPFGVLIIVAAVYQSLSELVLRATGGWDLIYINPPIEWSDQGAIIANGSLMLATLTYCLSAGSAEFGSTYDRQHLARIFDWRLFLILAIPLLIATVRGEGYAIGRALDVADGDSTLTGFAVQLFVPVVIFLGFGFVLRYPRAWLVAVAAQALVVAIAGQRLEIVVVTVTTLLLLRLVGIRPAKRQVAASGFIALLLVVAIGGVRAGDTGREVFQGETGATARLAAILSGAGETDYDGVVSDNLVVDAAARLNSIPWAGQVAWALEGTNASVDGETLWKSVLATVPSRIYPQKSALAVWEKSPEQYGIDILGVPDDDYLPGHFASHFALLTMWPQFLWAAFLGVVLGWADRFSMAKVTAGRVLLYGILVMAAIFFEKGASYYLIAARSWILLGFILVILTWVRSSKSPNALYSEPTKGMAV